jgi:LacI family transcriptional regulator
MSKKKTTIHDIARVLNVTASTVSRALNNHPNISDSTKKLVAEMAIEMNYQPNNIAAALRKGKSNTVGVIVPEADRNFFSSVIRGIEEIVNLAGYNVIICQSNDLLDKEKASINSLLKLRVDGILASYAKEVTNFDHYQDIVRKGVPLILFDRYDESLEVGSVVIDDYLGSFKATEHLIQQGCRRIVHFAGPQNVSIYRERKRGYMEALRRNKVELDESLIISSKLKFESGQEHALDLLKWEQLPDAIFSASDFSAIGAMITLKEKGISIPDQVAMVGFSNEPFTSFVDPALSTVNQHPKVMGQYAANTFLNQISSKASFIPGKTTLTPELIVRASSLKEVVEHAGSY